MTEGPATDVVADLGGRGMVYQRTPQDLGARLAAHAPVTAYHGIDATAPSLHVGNLVGVRALRRLQQAGHRPVVLLGGATTLIGDPSGKATERPLRPAEEVAANVAAIGAQLERFLDLDAGSGARLVDNAAWFGPMTLTTFLRDVGRHFGVNAMLDKESVRARLGGGISFTEFSYMLLQAYDFVHLHDTLGCRLQVGGSDQWGNITAGIDLLRRMRGVEAWGLTWPLLTRADGTKFGKSDAGNVWLDAALTSPYAFFQFWVRADDADVGRWLRLFTDLPADRVAELEVAVAQRPGGREAQEALAWELTAAVHGTAAAAAARRAAAALYGGDLASLDPAALTEVFAEAPATDRPLSDLGPGGPTVVDLAVEAGLLASRTAARTALSAGGVYLNGSRVTDPDRRLSGDDLLAGGVVVLRRGKRHHHVLRFR